MKERNMSLKQEFVRTQQLHPVDLLQDIQNMRSVAEALMKTRHYQQLGPDGIFAVIQKAKSLNINPLEALNGGLYYVQGRVEMSAQMMNQLIRSRGHSIQKDSKSTKQLCILHGKRADNGDTWSVNFGVEDAQRAGIYRPNTPWTKFTEAMCFARALSMLARQLFPDVIQGCYVEGEICDSLNTEPTQSETSNTIAHDQIQYLETLIGDDEEYTKKLLAFFKIDSFEQLHISQWDRIVASAKRHVEEKQKQVERLSNIDQVEEEYLKKMEA